MHVSWARRGISGDARFRTLVQCRPGYPDDQRVLGAGRCAPAGLAGTSSVRSTEARTPEALSRIKNGRRHAFWLSPDESSTRAARRCRDDCGGSGIDRGHYDIAGYRFEAEAAARLRAILPVRHGDAQVIIQDRVCQHVHYLVTAPGHEPLITRLYALIPIRCSTEIPTELPRRIR